MTILQFPFVSGLDENGDPKTRPPGTLTTLVNCEWTKDGRLDKRSGTAGLSQNISGGGTISAAARLVTRGTELCLIDGSSLYSYSSLTSTWKNLGKVPELACTWRPMVGTSVGIQASDICRLSDGRIVHVWVTGDPTATNGGSPTRGAAGGVFLEILDPTTMARTTPPVVLTTDQASIVRLVTDGTNYIAVWNANNAGSGELHFSINGGAGSVLAVGSNTALYTPFDICLIGSVWDIAWVGSTGVLALSQFDFTGANKANVSTGLTQASIQCISIDGRTGESLYVGYAWSYNGTLSNAQMVVANADTLAIQVAAFDVIGDFGATESHLRIGVARYDSAHCVYAVEQSVFGGVASIVVSNVGTKIAHRSTANANLVSRPFMLNGRAYMFLQEMGAKNQFADESHTYLVEIEVSVSAIGPARFVGYFNILTAGKWTIGHVSNVVTVSATQVYACLPVLLSGETNRNDWLQGDQLVSVTTGSSVPLGTWRGVELANEAQIAGATLTVYDGRRPFDFGFPRASSITSVTPGGGSTAFGNLAAGNYIYSAMPRFRSAAGIVYRGPVSADITATTVNANTSNVALQVTPQTLGWKGTNATAANASQEALPVDSVLYRTTVNGLSPQELTVEPRFNYLLNDPTASLGYNAFTDKAGDASLDLNTVSPVITLASRPGLYTIGELDDYPPPAHTTIHLHKNRLFVIAGDQKTLWVSKDYTNNVGTAPGFNPEIIVPIDDTLIGMRTMDEKLVVFGQNAIWLVLGDGPSSNGDGGYEVIRVQTDVGCSNPRSLVTTPDGIMFQTTRGLYLLDRMLQVTWIGKFVRDQLTSFPNITSAVLVATKNQVRFTCNNSGTTAGVVLVFDYVRKQWSTFKYYDTSTSTASTPIADACISNGVYTFVTPGGKVFQESTSYLDGGSQWVSSSWELALISADGPLGYQRVRRAYLRGSQYTDCDLTLSVAVDDSASYVQTHTFTAANLQTIADGDNVGIVMQVQKTRAFKLLCQDATPSSGTVGTGQGVSFSAIGFDIVPKPGMDRRQPTAMG